MSGRLRALPCQAFDGLVDILRSVRGHFIEIHDPERCRAVRVLFTLLWAAAVACDLLA